MARVIGVSVVALIKFIKSQLKKRHQNFDEFLLKLKDEKGRQVFAKRILSSDWYPYDVFTDLLTLAVDEFGGGDPMYARQMGRLTADGDLMGVYKAFLRFGPGQTVISRFPNIWTKYFDAGKEEFLELGKGKAQLKLYDFPGIRRVTCLMIEGWTERYLELSGGKNVSVRQTECAAQGGPYCLFEIVYEDK